MPGKKIAVRVFRFDEATGVDPSYGEYAVPFERGMSAMDALDYIYQNIDSTLAYYDHAGCSLGICARCTAKVNGKPGLLCQTEVHGDILIEPINTSKVLKDLVVKRSGNKASEKDMKNCGR